MSSEWRGTSMRQMMMVATIGMLAGCGPQPEGKAAPAAATTTSPAEVAERPPTTRAMIPTNDWLGRWIGPEGTYLEISADGGAASGRYTLKMQYTLDDVGSFAGLASKDTIVFTRGGHQEVIRAGTGDETGLKWMAGKSNCLIVKDGEGYCRD
jgi:hypothetical protein